MSEIDQENSTQHFDSASDYVQDDSQKDGRRRAMRRAKQNRMAAILIAVSAVLLITLILTAIFARKTGEDEPSDPTEVRTEISTETEPQKSSAESPADTETEVPTEPEDTTECETEPTETEPQPTDPPQPTETQPQPTETEPQPTEPPLPTQRPFPAYRELVPGLQQNPQINVNTGAAINMPSWIVQDLLSVNTAERQNGRPGTKLSSVKHIVIHYVGNTLSTAKDNRDYFQYQDGSRNVSSHFVVGLYGEVIQCVPINEKAHAQGGTKNVGGIDHNTDSLSIETCHYNDEGQFTNETYQGLVKLTAFLLEQYGLPATPYEVNDQGVAVGTIWMHYHCSGKGCPRYWVYHMDEYHKFVNDVQKYMAAHPNIQ